MGVHACISNKLVGLRENFDSSLGEMDASRRMRPAFCGPDAPARRGDAPSSHTDATVATHSVSAPQPESVYTCVLPSLGEAAHAALDAAVATTPPPQPRAPGTKPSVCSHTPNRHTRGSPPPPSAHGRPPAASPRRKQNAARRHPPLPSVLAGGERRQLGARHPGCALAQPDTAITPGVRGLPIDGLPPFIPRRRHAHRVPHIPDGCLQTRNSGGGRGSGDPPRLVNSARSQWSRSGGEERGRREEQHKGETHPIAAAHHYHPCLRAAPRRPGRRVGDRFLLTPPHGSRWQGTPSPSHNAP